MASNPGLISTVTVGRDAGVTVVRAAGQLTDVSAPLLRTQAGRLVDASVLIVDMTDVVFCDSAGLTEWVGLWRRGRSARTRLLLAGAGPHLTQVLKLTGLDAIFEIHPQVAAALRAAGQPSTPAV
ncbi:STAS domain-containing protein [Microbispora sp. NPDC046973]|uniref:STAS domain-containing protein n=1 Tax=Microbispora sp. NPDC046973 TaxID=3155022 RepID=UPI003400F377